MSIKKFIASKDTTITDAFKENLLARAINANMGEADSLEVFTIFGQASSASLEKSRILIEFPIEQISNQRTSGLLPASGSVEFYLKLYNVEHPFTVPRNFMMSINPLSKSWEEGYGLDMDSYSDNGYITGQEGYGATWIMASSGSQWDKNGGDIITGSYYDMSASFITGLENIDINITQLTEDWLSGLLPNNGLLIKLSGAYEEAGLKQSFYTKKFSARGSEFYLSRPCIEARWNPSITDDRNNFYASSSLLSEEDNLMNIYFYNKVNGLLKNIVGNPIPVIKFFSNLSLTQEITSSYTLVTNPLPGVYKAQVALNTTASIVYDKWVDTATQTIKYYSGEIEVLQRENDSSAYNTEYVLNINNLKPIYKQNELARFNIFARERDWQPNIYTVAYNNIQNTAIPNLYYKIFRFNDNYTIIDYSTGSLAYTKTSYDSNGNYFELDMNIFEKDYGYGIKLATWDGNSLREFKDTYKFRIE